MSTRILHIDDCAAVRRFVKTVLLQSGIEVIEANNGKKGLECLQKNPALIVINPGMSHTNALEFGNKVKELCSRFIPVVHLGTSLTDAAALAASLDLGADAGLPFPVPPDVLRSTVRSLLRIQQNQEMAFASARQWQTAFHTMTDGICVTDPRLNIVQCNPSMAEILDGHAGQLNGKNLASFLSGETLTQPFNAPRKTKIKTANGQGRDFLYRAEAVRDATNKVAALVHVFTDLTELHHIHGPHEMSPVKVLLVDDNKVSQVLVATILRKWSHEVTTVTNGKEAIDAHKNQGFDVIIMDLNMPIMDGFQAAGVIRETEKDGRRRVPIIALTSSASERDRCLKEGLDEFLVKPVNYSDLASAIQRSLRATGESKGDRELFDGSRLKGKFEGSTRVLRLTIDKFIDLCPEMISQIKQAIAHHQPESLAFAANDLRMNLTVFGPSRAAEKAIRLEQMGKSEVLDGADLTFKELEADLQEVLLSLPSLLAESMAWNTPHRTAS